MRVRVAKDEQSVTKQQLTLQLNPSANYTL